LNPGAARLKNGRIILYVRGIEQLIINKDENYFYSPRFIGENKFEIKIDRFEKKLIHSFGDFDFSFKDGTKRLSYISHLRRVILDKEGEKILKIEQSPGFYGLSWDAELGVEDARITKIGEVFYMTYVALSRKENISTSLALSNDGIRWYRRGIIFEEQDKDVVLFPNKIDGKFVVFGRPEGNFEFTQPHIWIAKSRDTEYWGKFKAISFLKKDALFERSGAGPPPLKTKKGWLLIFHVVTEKYDHRLKDSFKKILGMKNQPYYSYDVWAALFDLKDPQKLIALSCGPIITPKGKYAKSFEDKVVLFPTGVIGNKKNLLVYSGVGDKYVGVNHLKLDKIINSMKKVE
jgi:beta-1,2-mannobiose phosphorylase / 1,2-beta-oligomannan phosphorylase